MSGLLNETTSLVLDVIGLVVIMVVLPFLVKLLYPPLGEPVWRGYWRLVGWALMVPVRLVVWVVRTVGRRNS